MHTHKILILTLIFISAISANAQKKKLLKAPQPPSPYSAYNNLPKFKYLPFKSIVEKYPYNNTSNIHLVSNQPTKDSFRNLIRYDFPIKNDTICYTNFHEIKVLTLTEIETLTKLLFVTNINYTVRTYIERGCYFPRNAIIFNDNKGNLLGYIEICFECNNFKLSDEKIKVGKDLKYNISHLKSFFKNAGIDYGIK